MADLATVKNRVQGMLTELGNVMLDSDGDFSFEDGSTRVFVRVLDHDTFTVVSVFAPVLRKVPASPDLYKYVAESSDQFTFGHHALATNDDGTCNLAFVNRLYGEYLDAEELKHSVYAVAWTADNLDDELKGRFGGLRYIDRDTP